MAASIPVLMRKMLWKPSETHSTFFFKRRRDVHARGLPDVERQLPSSAAVATLSSSLEQLRQDLQRLPGELLSPQVPGGECY